MTLRFQGPGDVRRFDKSKVLKNTPRDILCISLDAGYLSSVVEDLVAIGLTRFNDRLGLRSPIMNRG